MKTIKYGTTRRSSLEVGLLRRWVGCFDYVIIRFFSSLEEVEKGVAVRRKSLKGVSGLYQRREIGNAERSLILLFFSTAGSRGKKRLLATFKKVMGSRCWG